MKLAALPVLLLCVLGCSKSKPMEPFDPWIGWQEGTWVEKVSRHHSSMMGNENQGETGIRITLRSVTPEERVLVLVTGTGDESSSQEMRISRVPAPPADAQAPAATSEEDLEIGGRRFHCQVYRYGQSASWICPEAGMRGGMLKMQSGSATMQVTAVDEMMRVGEREVHGWVEETIVTAGPGSRAKTWNSLEVPGVEVRREMTQTTPMGSMETQEEVVAFEGKR